VEDQRKEPDRKGYDQRAGGVVEIENKFERKFGKMGNIY